jgi:hypothetical protein
LDCAEDFVLTRKKERKPDVKREVQFSGCFRTTELLLFRKPAHPQHRYTKRLSISDLSPRIPRSPPVKIDTVTTMAATLPLSANAREFLEPELE